MAVIPFPDRVKPAVPEDNSRTLPGLRDAHQDYSRTPCSKNNDAVRHFALRVAGKLLSDPELNQAMPFLVDKIVRVLMTESRDS